jgi:uncharacterized protein (DUF1015 family)
MRDATPFYYVYRLTVARPVQTGLAASPRSPTTRPTGSASTSDHAVKEDDRVRQIEAVNAQTGPVMIGLSGGAGDRRDAGRARPGDAEVDVTADDGVRHQMWVVDDEPTIGALTGPSMRCRRSTSPTATTARPRPRASPRRGGSTGSHGYFLT